MPGERTLRHWATKGDWAAATARALRTIAPDLMEGLVTDLIMGATEGMTYMRDVLAGRIGQPDATRIRAILTAFSMIGVPDLAHATIRDAMRESDAARALPVNVTSNGPSEPESLAAVKARIAAKMGFSDQEPPKDDDTRPSRGWGTAANDGDRCSA
jgi:hypothetical protein